MITLILFAITGLLKAIQDTLLPERKYRSVFKNLESPFWVKGSGKKTWYGYYWDAWHIADSLKYLIAPLAVMLFSAVTPYIALDMFLMLLSSGVTFNLFYDLILKRQ
jgi:hypothetical protein